MIELRSDTFTMPTARMREAMASAVVGNDVYREDPTVRALEEKAADLLGKPAACLMPSGTMANLAAIMAQVPRGGKVVCGDESDIYLHEAGGAAVCGGAVYSPVSTGPDGRLALDDLAASFPADPSDPEYAPVALVCLENSHNRTGGQVLSTAYVESVAALARANGIPLHIDGARLFNAAAHLAAAPAELARPADTVQFCLSKGLSAPIGSVLVGDRRTVDRAWRIRKMLGGGMRQAGVIAAAGVVALDEMRARLVDDHANARRLAVGLATVPGVEVDPAAVQTNIVMFRVAAPWTPPAFVAACADQGVAVAELGHGRIRAVTHAQIGPLDIDRAVRAIRSVLRTVPLAAATVGGER
jgi:threonine aldolase